MSADTSNDFRIKPGSGWAGAWKKAAALGVIGLGLGGFGFTQDAKRFAFSYLFAFFFFVSLGLGSLFFVVVQHITKAGWSVTVRRVAEFFMAGLPVFVLLILPLLPLMEHLFPWLQSHHGGGVHEKAHAEIALVREAHASDLHAPPPPHGPPGHGKPSAPQAGHGASSGTPEAAVEAAKAHEHAQLLAGKKSYLNKPFFLVRQAIYVVVWAVLAFWFFKNSTDQDKSKSKQATLNAQTIAPLALALFGLTLTFAAFDWLMSLNPTWYSTIYGVQVFAGGFVAALSVLVLVTMTLPALRSVVNVEHYHDIGKLLFGFNCFWAYVSFSQFFLIWYSNIPEELAYFHMRWSDNGGTWRVVTAALPIVHFAIPFWLLMSRNVKRNSSGLILGAVVLLLVQIVEMYWNVLPNFGPLTLHWLDLACFLGVGGVYLAVVFHRMENFSLVAVGDPRLDRALHFENA